VSGTRKGRLGQRGLSGGGGGGGEICLTKRGGGNEQAKNVMANRVGNTKILKVR